MLIFNPLKIELEIKIKKFVCETVKATIRYFYFLSKR